MAQLKLLVKWLRNPNLGLLVCLLTFVISFWFFYRRIYSNPLNRKLSLKEKVRVAMVQSFIFGMGLGLLPLPSLSQQSNEVISSQLKVKGGGKENSNDDELSNDSQSSGLADAFSPYAPLNPPGRPVNPNNPFIPGAKQKTTEEEENSNNDWDKKQNARFDEYARNEVTISLLGGLKAEAEKALNNNMVKEQLQALAKTLEEPMINWKHNCEPTSIKGILAFKTAKGARLYFRIIGPNQIQIVGLGSKHHQKQFYDLLRKYYG